MIFSALLFCLVLVSTAQALVSFGSCPESPIISDFDASKYAGRWYEIERFPARFEKDLSCVTADYGFVNSTQLTVKNSGTNLKKNVTSSVNGVARVDDLTRPNFLKVVFPIKILGFDFSNEGNYHVWSTDYSQYSVVYSCTKIAFIKIEYVWILSRTKTLDERVVQRLKDFLTAREVEIENFERVAQTCNN